MKAETLDCLRVTRQCELTCLKQEMACIIGESEVEKAHSIAAKCYKKLCECAEQINADYKHIIGVLREHEKAERKAEILNEISRLENQITKLKGEL